MVRFDLKMAMVRIYESHVKQLNGFKKKLELNRQRMKKTVL